MNTLTYYPILDEDYGDIKKRAKLDAVSDYIEHNIATVMEIVEHPSLADIIIVGGGDGFMLKTMRAYKDQGAMFMGLNAGTRGFLMNHMEDILKMPKTEHEFETVNIPLTPVTVTTNTGELIEGFYINEALLGSHVGDYFRFKVSKDGKEIIIPGSGLVVNSPAGSTGYAANLKQPILNLASNMQGLAGIGTLGFEYGYLEPPHNIIIKDIHGRDSLDLILDGKNCVIIRDIKSITISPPTEYLTIAFTQNQNFQDRRVLLAQESNGNVIQTL